MKTKTGVRDIHDTDIKSTYLNHATYYFIHLMKGGQIKVPFNFLDISARRNEQTEPGEDESLLTETGKHKTAGSEVANTTAYNYLCKLTKVTIAIHVVSCIVISAGTLVKMGGNNSTPRFGDGRVWRIASCWSVPSNMSDAMPSEAFDGSITNRMSPSMGFERLYIIAFLLIVFFFLSALFQYMSLASANHRNNILNNKPQWFRYTEYSLSASCMIVAIFISFGMLDSYLHISVFTLTFLCMIIGLAADYVRYLTDTTDTSISESLLIKLRLVALRLHYLGWVPMLLVWGILVLVVFDMANGTFWEICGSSEQGSDLPNFVWIVVIGEFTLFNAFGYVQWKQIGKQFDIRMYKIDKLRFVQNPLFLHTNKSYDAATTGLSTERTFIILSLVAKSLLGWTIFSQVIMG